jgi:hypothetical protein
MKAIRKINIFSFGGQTAPVFCSGSCGVRARDYDWTSANRALISPLFLRRDSTSRREGVFDFEVGNLFWTQKIPGARLSLFTILLKKDSLDFSRFTSRIISEIEKNQQHHQQWLLFLSSKSLSWTWRTAPVLLSLQSTSGLKPTKRYVEERESSHCFVSV